MSVAETRTDAELAEMVRDHLRLQIVGMGHNATNGEVHVTDHGIMAHMGGPSLFNRATALDLDQFDVTMEEVDRFFGPMPHSLWLAEPVDEISKGMLRERGYVALPPQTGMVLQGLGEAIEAYDPDQHPELLTDPAFAAGIADVTATGFGLGVDDRLLYEDLARAILRHARPWHHGAIYATKRDAAIRAVGLLLCTTESAGLTGIVTRTEDRRKGLGRHLVARMLHDAAAMGIGVACAIATPDSQGVLDELGFREATRFLAYRRAA